MTQLGITEKQFDEELSPAIVQRIIFMNEIQELMHEQVRDMAAGPNGKTTRRIDTSPEARMRFFDSLPSTPTPTPNPAGVT